MKTILLITFLSLSLGLKAQIPDTTYTPIGKDIDYPFTTHKYNTGHRLFIDYAIEAFEKDHNIIYLPE